MMPVRNNRLRRRNRRPARGDEAGYTLLLALFLAALMIIAAAVAVPNLITQDRRQKEELMIWRGQQYARAIGLYYRVTGHFPHDLEELEKGVNGIHVLRQVYNDPMSSDGSWRLIYVGTGGQLVGSLCWHSLTEYQAAEMGVPLSAAPTAGSTSPGTTSATGSATGGSMESESESNSQKPPTAPTCGMFGAGPSSALHPQIVTEGGMIGGNLIGVAGTVDASSIKNYMGAGNYRYWEFIWNPQEGSQTAPGATAPPLSGAPSPSNPASPPGSPLTPQPPISPAPQPPANQSPQP
jgi:type II secretory pathway pseudopilin PulG